MSLAWLKMLQAHFDEQGRERELYKRDSKKRRQRTEDGDWKMRSLSALLAETYTESNPIRRNVEFFLGLRHKVEHRYDGEVAALVAGKAQAIVLNYERELVRMFGASEGLAQELRFPVFLGSITDDAVEVLKGVRARTPRSVLDYIQDFDASLEPDVASDSAYEFRVVLVPQTGPKTEADVAMSFVRLDALDDEQREQVERAFTIIREKTIPVHNDNVLLPKDVAARVVERLSLRFTVTDHTKCWQHYGVRPPEGSNHPERTKSDFCRWDKTFRRHVYTVAWAEYLVRRLRDTDEHRAVLGRDPVPSAVETTRMSAQR
nr:DUF3644 domain-containing protein [Miltoncostaea oceani]